ncbi:hypothetical protein AGABI1DRAFT_127401 [Agaricus bisporus var. burnettii JB137-S8]|uniref:Uncharacterized protein n=1 Tax=Agaricus bisporus var. burnettii (strain JB137-S8 / ATCC MYA-4627 / FGSC 10392) TaxID=597362 RepID=K5XWT7_AGABU|nr:uncharacterized protein AGABI1DRAFT_127401 [Agaricus bisporus var. burnettii JB137-S8]EKM79715.1 hypothetical protein AGABI1DRAFT_127401 [Agaricus bisporus var. burnettii JB137-S8]
MAPSPTQTDAEPSLPTQLPPATVTAPSLDLRRMLSRSGSSKTYPVVISRPHSVGKTPIEPSTPTFLDSPRIEFRSVQSQLAPFRTPSRASPSKQLNELNKGDETGSESAINLLPTLSHVPSSTTPLHHSVPPRLPMPVRTPVIDSRQGEAGFPISADLFRPTATPIANAPPSHARTAPIRRTKALGSLSRNKPYPATHPKRKEVHATEKSAGFCASQDLFKPTSTPIANIGQALPHSVLSLPGPYPANPQPSPLLHRSQITPLPLARNHLASPFHFPDSNGSVDVRRRLDFMRPGPSSSRMQPPTPYYREPRPNATVRPSFPPRTPSLVIIPSTAASTLQSTISPNYRNPSRTPIPNNSQAVFGVIPLPVLDGDFAYILQAAMLSLRDKCPLCYYQGLPHRHRFFLCPINAKVKLACQRDIHWERWKGEIFVRELDTHCYGCFVPTEACVTLRGKRLIKFHKGDRGFPDKDKTREGCMYRDTIVPMIYLAWRLGNMPDLLSRYQGLDHVRITSDLNSFSKWLIKFEYGRIPPCLLILATIISIRGPP